MRYDLVVTVLADGWQIAADHLECPAVFVGACATMPEVWRARCVFAVVVEELSSVGEIEVSALVVRAV